VTAPSVADLSPDDEANEVAENAKLEITFSEEVQVGSGDITITVNGTVQTVGVRTAAVKINKEKVTIEAGANFPAGATVSVAVPAGAFEDAAGNDFGGLTAGSWNFTVKPAPTPTDNTAPLVADLSPDNGLPMSLPAPTAWKSPLTRTSARAAVTSPYGHRRSAEHWGGYQCRQSCWQESHH
jgi:hypothetical protein